MTGSKAFFVALGLVLAAVLAPRGARGAPPTIYLTYASSAPASTFPSVQMEKWKETVEGLTRGAVKIKTYPDASFLDAKNMMEGVTDGLVDIGCVAFPSLFRGGQLLEGVDLPVGFTNAKVANAVLWDLYEKYVPASPDKLKTLVLFTAPPAEILSEDPIRGLADLKGYPLGCTGEGTAPLRLLGAAPTAMPESEIPEALRKGTVKGAFSSLDVLKDYDLAKGCRYVTIVHMQTASFGVVMNRARWNALPDDVKSVFEDAAREHSQWAGEFVDDRAKASLAWSEDEHGLQVITLALDEYRAWHDRVKPLVDEWEADSTAKGLPAGAFLADLYALKERYEAEYGEQPAARGEDAAGPQETSARGETKSSSSNGRGSPGPEGGDP